MLEVDDDSRLGRELIAGGTRYHAHFVPDEDADRGFLCHGLRTAGSGGNRRNTKFPISRAQDSSRGTT